VSLARKIELFEVVQNCSKREAEKAIGAATGLTKSELRPERTIATGDGYLIQFNANQKLKDMIDQVKAALSHAHPNMSTGELVEKLCADFISSYESKRAGKGSSRVGHRSPVGNSEEKIPTKNHSQRLFSTDDDAGRLISNVGGSNAKIPNNCITEDKNPTSSTNESQHSSKAEVQTAPARKPANSLSSSRTSGSENVRRPIPRSIQREVYRKYEGRCECCHSKWHLEVDHIIPVARGGSDELTNLRLLCPSCNRRAAIETLGLAKMEEYQRH
jgi:5-methylcytosine-specific restriction enzyme A